MFLASAVQLGYYEIVGPLGQSGMGEVCRAKNALGRQETES
jgi:hypothetical protein